MASQMKMETVILMQTRNWNTAEHLARFLCSSARHRGGSAWAGWARPTLRIRLQGISRAGILTAQREIEAFALQRNISLSIVEKHTKATPIPNLACGIIPWGSLVKQRLTKALLLALPEEACVRVRARGNRNGGGFAGFTGRLDSVEAAGDVWLRAVAAKAANRVCRVTWPRD